MKKEQNHNLVKAKNAELQRQIIEASQTGVVYLNEHEVKALGIVFGKKNSVAALINNVLFIAYKVFNEENNSWDYALERKFDQQSTPDSISVITDAQAHKIGLNEDVSRVQIGDDIYKVHYINSDELPEKFKNFALKEKAPKVSDEKFLTYQYTEEKVDSELADFFQVLRSWKPKHALGRHTLIANALTETSSLLDETTNVVEVTDLARKTGAKFAPKEVDHSDYFNIHKVPKTGYHFLPDNVLINELQPDQLMLSNEREREAALQFTYKDNFKSVSNFWSKLVHFYNTNPASLDRKLKQIATEQTSELPVFALEQQELEVLVPSRDGHEVLRTKLTILDRRELKLVNQLETLKAMLEQNQLETSTSEDYLKFESELEAILAEKEAIRQELQVSDEKLANPEVTDSNFAARNYVNAQGSAQALTNDETYVSEHVNNFDDRLNAIEFKKKEFERLLFERVKSVHEARKAKARFEILLKDEANARSLKEFEANEKERLRLFELAEQARIRDNTALVQDQIRSEEDRITDNLASLQEFQLIEDFETRIQEIKQKQDALLVRKQELSDVLVSAREVLLKIHRNVANECIKMQQAISTLEEEAQKLANELHDDVHLGVKLAQKMWDEQAIVEIDKIFVAKSKFLPQVSDVISSQIDRLSVEQLKQLNLALERQADWTKVYAAIVDEYKSLGYYMLNPKIESVEFGKSEFSDPIEVKLSPSVEKIINLNFNLSIDKSFENKEIQAAKCALLGLEPRMKDDDEFEIIDQVGEATEAQLAALKLCQAEQVRMAQAQAMSDAQLAEQKALKQAKIDAEEAIQKEKEALLQKELAAEEQQVRKRLELEEAEALQIAQYRQQLNSNLTGAFKAEMFDLAGQLITKKQVELVNKEIVISDIGSANTGQTEIYDSKTFFLKPEENQLFENSDSPYITKEALDGDDLEAKFGSDYNEVGQIIDQKIGSNGLAAADLDPNKADLVNLKSDDESEILQISKDGVNMEGYIDPSDEDGIDEAHSGSSLKNIHMKTAQLVNENGNPLQTPTEEYFTEIDNLKQDLETMKQNVASETMKNPNENAESEALTATEQNLTERTVYKVPLINLTGFRKRIQMLDQEINELAKYTSRQGKKIQEAVNKRDELKDEFERELNSASLDFNLSQEEIEKVLNSDVEQLVASEHADHELEEAQALASNTEQLANLKDQTTVEIFPNEDYKTVEKNDWNEETERDLIGDPDPLVSNDGQNSSRETSENSSFKDLSTNTDSVYDNEESQESHSFAQEAGNEAVEPVEKATSEFSGEKHVLDAEEHDGDGVNEEKLSTLHDSTTSLNENEETSSEPSDDGSESESHSEPTNQTPKKGFWTRLFGRK